MREDFLALAKHAVGCAARLQSMVDLGERWRLRADLMRIESRFTWPPPTAMAALVPNRRQPRLLPSKLDREVWLLSAGAARLLANSEGRSPQLLRDLLRRDSRECPEVHAQMCAELTVWLLKHARMTLSSSVALDGLERPTSVE